jgi:sec-independent protein translocase protein TatC
MSLLSKFFQFREQADGEMVKPFLDHMEDLRWMLLKMLLSLTVAMSSAFYFRSELMSILQAPLSKVDPELPGQLVTNDIAGSFSLSMTLAFYAGIVFSLPLLTYYLAGFVLPALTRKEKKMLFPGILAGFVLFMAGVVACYEWILPETLRFFFEDAKKMQVKTLWTWGKYASFCSWLTIGFGLLSELPLVVLALAIMGVVNFELLSRTRPYAYTAILILAAIVAPTPDPVTFVTLSFPILALYEVCIWIVWVLDRRRRRKVAVSEYPE